MHAVMIREINGKLFATPITFKTGECLLSAIKRFDNAKNIYPTETFKDAQRLADFQNHTFKQNKTYLYEEATT